MRALDVNSRLRWDSGRDVNLGREIEEKVRIQLERWGRRCDEIERGRSEREACRWNEMGRTKCEVNERKRSARKRELERKGESGRKS